MTAGRRRRSGQPPLHPHGGNRTAAHRPGFSLAFDFFRRVRDLNHAESVYHLISWNYMPPSGSSLIHPHLQVFATSTAPNELRQELMAAKVYLKRHGSNYWDDLVQVETAQGKRYLGKTGRISWLAGFAPFGVAGDVIGVAADCRATLDLSEPDLTDLAFGLPGRDATTRWGFTVSTSRHRGRAGSLCAPTCSLLAPHLL
jgi:hypothetical protein